MAPVEWAQRIAEAQKLTTLPILGTRYPRVAHGTGRRGSGDGPCEDCAVLPGQLHVLGCDLEECPRCAAQLLTCACFDADIDDDDDEATPR